MAKSGDPEGRERLVSIRDRLLASVEAGTAGRAAFRDLNVIASVLGTPDEQLEWFLRAAPLDSQRSLNRERGYPWFDPIRELPGYHAWLEGQMEDISGQLRELEALGPWTPEAILGGR